MNTDQRRSFKAIRSIAFLISVHLFLSVVLFLTGCNSGGAVKEEFKPKEEVKKFDNQDWTTVLNHAVSFCESAQRTASWGATAFAANHTDMPSSSASAMSASILHRCGSSATVSAVRGAVSARACIGRQV